MSDPTISDIDFKNKMVWVLTTLNSMPPIYRVLLAHGNPNYKFSCQLPITQTTKEMNKKLDNHNQVRF